MKTPKDNIGILIADVSRLLRRALESKRNSASLTLAQARTLLYLSRNEGINQVQLAELLEVQPITLARQIDLLEKQGLVERRADPQDRRAHRLFLLPASAESLAELQESVAAIRANALHGLGKSEIAQLFHYLQVMRSNLATAAPEKTDAARQSKASTSA